MRTGTGRSAFPVALALGAAAGVSALAYAVIRRARAVGTTPRSHEKSALDRELDALEERVVAALRNDPVAGNCAIDVAVVAPGLVELSGVVPDHDASQRAARVLHSVPGVRTVVNRLEEGSVENRLAELNARRARGDAALAERHWYGVRVGTGRRRQSPDTDPDRPDDTVERRTRELEVSEADLADADVASDRFE